MQWEHVVVLAGEDLVAGLHDQLVASVVQPAAGMVRDGGGLLQDRVARDHLARNEVLADREMLQRALRLRSPQLVGGNPNLTKAVNLSAHICHRSSLTNYNRAKFPSAS